MITFEFVTEISPPLTKSHAGHWLTKCEHLFQGGARSIETPAFFLGFPAFEILLSGFRLQSGNDIWRKPICTLYNLLLMKLIYLTFHIVLLNCILTIFCVYCKGNPWNGKAQLFWEYIGANFCLQSVIVVNEIEWTKVVVWVKALNLNARGWKIPCK